MKNVVVFIILFVIMFVGVAIMLLGFEIHKNNRDLKNLEQNQRIVSVYIKDTGDTICEAFSIITENVAQIAYPKSSDLKVNKALISTICRADSLVLTVWEPVISDCIPPDLSLYQMLVYAYMKGEDQSSNASNSPEGMLMFSVDSLGQIIKGDKGDYKTEYVYQMTIICDHKKFAQPRISIDNIIVNDCGTIMPSGELITISFNPLITEAIMARVANYKK